MTNKKKDTPVPDKGSAGHVCIDDFAFKKGNTYGTIMTGIDTRQVTGLLDTRETGAVTEWLKSFPNPAVVSRDGSVSYRKAITDAGAGIMQISDRFHLLKGLTDAAKKHIDEGSGGWPGRPRRKDRKEMAGQPAVQAR